MDLPEKLTYHGDGSKWIHEVKREGLWECQYRYYLFEIERETGKGGNMKEEPLERILTYILKPYPKVILHFLKNAKGNRPFMMNRYMGERLISFYIPPES